MLFVFYLLQHYLMNHDDLHFGCFPISFGRNISEDIAANAESSSGDNQSAGESLPMEKVEASETVRTFST